MWTIILSGPFRGAIILLNPCHSPRKVFGLYEHELNPWLKQSLRRVTRVLDVARTTSTSRSVARRLFADKARAARSGRIRRLLYAVLDGGSCPTYAGRCLGPALNPVPEDRDDLPDVVVVEWLNTTCMMYRREALPTPAFDAHFTGYSMMKDLALSLTVIKRWKLANARTARIFHDSQQGSHKSSSTMVAEMELVNRHYVTTQVLGQQRPIHYVKLAVWELFTLAGASRGPMRQNAGHDSNLVG